MQLVTSEVHILTGKIVRCKPMLVCCMLKTTMSHIPTVSEPHHKDRKVEMNSYT